MNPPRHSRYSRARAREGITDLTYFSRIRKILRDCRVGVSFPQVCSINHLFDIALVSFPEFRSSHLPPPLPSFSSPPPPETNEPLQVRRAQIDQPTRTRRSRLSRLASSPAISSFLLPEDRRIRVHPHLGGVANDSPFSREREPTYLIFSKSLFADGVLFRLRAYNSISPQFSALPLSGISRARSSTRVLRGPAYHAGITAGTCVSPEFAVYGNTRSREWGEFRFRKARTLV